MSFSASKVIPVDTGTVHTVLTDMGRMASWNPAFTSVDAAGPAVTGRTYRAVVRGVAPVGLLFDRLEPGDIRYTIRGLGSVERGSWSSRPIPGGTEVSHAFEHTGLLLRLMRPAFGPVPEWRLERLRVQALSRAAPTASS
jgi:hypothetical protein